MLSPAGASQCSWALTLWSIHTETNAHGSPLNWKAAADGWKWFVQLVVPQMVHKVQWSHSVRVWEMTEGNSALKMKQ